MVCCLLLIIIFPFSKGLLQLLANQANRQIVDMFGLADRENLIRKEETYYQETTNPQDCLMISTNHGGGGGGVPGLILAGFVCRWPLRAPSLV